MKRITNIRTLILALMLCFPLGFCLVISPGCGTPPARVATEAAGTVVITVDTAMKMWADTVNAGKATQAQVDKVRAAYEKYYAASLVEKDALRAFVAAQTDTTNTAYQQAIAAAFASKTDLLNLITQFLPPATAAKLKGLAP